MNEPEVIYQEKNEDTASLPLLKARRVELVFFVLLLIVVIIWLLYINGKTLYDSSIN